MEPEGQKSEVQPTPVTNATINITFKGGKEWEFSADPYMAYDKTGDPPDTVTFRFTDASGHDYRMVKLKFTDAEGNSIPDVMQDWKVDKYKHSVLNKTINDVNHNTGSGDMQINYCVKIMDSDGRTKKSDPMIWDVKGSG